VMQQNYSYRTEKWRYILYRNGKEELYDMEDDLYSWNNLALDGRYSTIKDGLKQEVLEIIEKSY